MSLLPTYLYIQVVPLTFWCHLCDIIWRDTIYFSTASVTTLFKVVSLCVTIRELGADWAESWIVLDFGNQEKEELKLKRNLPRK